MYNLLMLLLSGMAVFMILLVLVQRGRGGGLTGALGGMGGQSAFGAKAGDVFTKITIWSATAWIVLCVVAVIYFSEKVGVAEKLKSGVNSSDTTSSSSSETSSGSSGTGNSSPPPSDP